MRRSHRRGACPDRESSRREAPANAVSKTDVAGFRGEGVSRPAGHAAGDLHRETVHSEQAFGEFGTAFRQIAGDLVGEGGSYTADGCARRWIECQAVDGGLAGALDSGQVTRNAACSWKRQGRRARCGVLSGAVDQFHAAIVNPSSFFHGNGYRQRWRPRRERPPASVPRPPAGWWSCPHGVIMVKSGLSMSIETIST